MKNQFDELAKGLAQSVTRRAALKKFGRIDYLVNNAALRQEKSIEEMTFEDWRLINGIIVGYGTEFLHLHYLVPILTEPPKAPGGKSKPAPDNFENRDYGQGGRL